MPAKSFRKTAKAVAAQKPEPTYLTRTKLYNMEKNFKRMAKDPDPETSAVATRVLAEFGVLRRQRNPILVMWIEAPLTDAMKARYFSEFFPAPGATPTPPPQEKSAPKSTKRNYVSPYRWQRGGVPSAKSKNLD